MSAEEIGELASLAVMDPKNESVKSIQVSNQTELSNTDQRQSDDCEEFRDRVRDIIDGVGKTYSSHEEDLPKLPIYDTSFRQGVQASLAWTEDPVHGGDQVLWI